jgi:ferric-dicitrate binding protein FerR (iron transport regulator)
MKLHRYLKRFLTSSSDSKDDEMQRAFELRIHQTQTTDPETNQQWQRLHRSLSELRLAEYTERRPIASAYRKPAIIFATSVIVLALVGSVWIRSFSTKTYGTTRGQHSSLLLADSTEVTLNQTSELIVQRRPFDTARRVTLTGEAFFHVKKNGEPFIITTEIGTVQVIGTTFNVRVRDNRMEVAVLSGCVQVHAIHNKTDNSVILTSGQITQCIKDSLPELPSSIPISRYPGWMDGNFVFYRTPLFSACKEIEAQFDTKIIIENLQSVSITGTIDGQSLERTLATLIQLTGKKIRHENSGYIIY